MLRILVIIALPCFFWLAPAFADEPLQARVETNIRAGNERSIFMTEFWVPFAQSADAVFYVDLRMMGDNQDNREGNLGLGYRQTVGFKGFKGVAGAHGWIDRRITARGSAFHQLTSGVEWLGERFDVRLNGYLPLSDKREITIANANPQGPELVGTGIVVDTNGTVLEEPQGGLDLELGLELGQYSEFIRENTDRFQIYAGGYYFDGPSTENVSGWRTRFTADVTKNIQFGARFQRDDVRGSQGFLEATFRFPFGQKRSFRKHGVRARLDESPERDIDIVTNEVIIDTGDRVQVLNTNTGAAQEVLHVDNSAAGGGDGSAENPFNSLSDAQAASSSHTIIYVNAGDGSDTNQDQGIALNQTGQQLIGSGVNFVYDNEKFTTANSSEPLGATVIAPATSAPVISNTNVNGDGVTVSADNITVAGIRVDGSGRDGIKVIADGAGASAQNITIESVTTQNNRQGIYIHATNGGSASARVQNAITTSNSQHGIAVYDDTTATFTADLGGGELGSTGNNVLAGNTLEDLAVEYDGRALSAQNNWWGQASGPDTDTPDIGIAPQIYYGAPINDGLVGHWTFDDEWTTNTTAYDRSGLGNDGTLQGGLSLADQVTGINGEALEFDGSNDFVEMGDVLDMGTNDWTIIAWIRTNNPNDGFYVSKSRAAAQNFRYGARVRSNGTSAPFFQGNGGADINWSNGSILIDDNNWHMITSVFDRDLNLSNYVNSVLDKGEDISHWDGLDVQSNNPFRIGSYTASNNVSRLRPFDGEIASVKILSRTLDASEISELYRMDTSSSVNTSSFLTSAP